MVSTTTPKGITGGTVVALVAVAAAIGIATASFQTPPSKDKKGDDETVALSLVLKPVQRDVPVHVTVMVSGQVVQEEFVSSSPWNTIVTAPKGAQVSMNAYQETLGDMDCFIYKNGLQVDHNHRFDPGSIRCWFNRV